MCGWVVFVELTAESILSVALWLINWKSPSIRIPLSARTVNLYALCVLRSTPTHLFHVSCYNVYRAQADDQTRQTNGTLGCESYIIIFCPLPLTEWRIAVRYVLLRSIGWRGPRRSKYIPFSNTPISVVVNKWDALFCGLGCWYEGSAAQQPTHRAMYKTCSLFTPSEFLVRNNCLINVHIHLATIFTNWGH